ncbi:DUF5995 family protein [Aliifodinibius salicampi]|uniref:DUF5995 family protein n=1 Tax=Fodinibius salicampi TaxID=1920655 RepID=A0ABT3Q1R0_9BACT|nr:DUF5995 family protein [Fodinibius salicampi]MCW9714035.1 DUF5995 family protein [Fodinibius salicampi]
MPVRNLQSIDEVLEELDDIIETTVEEGSPLAIFAFVYRRTTARIAEGIAEDTFEDPDRMERFDVDFAAKYIRAFWRYRHDKPVPFVWRTAFHAAEDPEGRKPIILQHLLLGMNAHINLDLGIAAAETAPGGQIQTLKKDFMTVNNLLEELIDEMQERIFRASPLLFLLDWIGKRSDEKMINFSLRRARDFAWGAAVTLAHADEEDKDHIIREMDEQIARVARKVLAPPGFLLPKVLGLIRMFEDKDIRVIIEKLRG